MFPALPAHRLYCAGFLIMPIDLIYRMHRSQPYVVDGSAFFFVDSPPAVLRTLSIMSRDRGTFGTLKLVTKVLLRRCVYFGLAENGKPQSTGLIALGYCRFYLVPSNAAVIGEIVTEPASRGQGHATRAIMLAINGMIRAGYTVFYIDTQRQNVPMIRSIEKLGFGQPIGGDAAGTSQ